LVEITQRRVSSENWLVVGLSIFFSMSVLSRQQAWQEQVTRARRFLICASHSLGSPCAFQKERQPESKLRQRPTSRVGQPTAAFPVRQTVAVGCLVIAHDRARCDVGQRRVSVGSAQVANSRHHVKSMRIPPQPPRPRHRHLVTQGRPHARSPPGDAPAA